MLVLSRKAGERIIIGENIELIVLEVRGDAVKLGIVAPSHVPVHREEIFRRLHPSTSQVPVKVARESPYYAEFA